MTTETYDNKPKFDPNKPFTAVEGKPAFDPNKPFEPVAETEKKKEVSGISSKGSSMAGKTEPKEEPVQTVDENDIISLSRKAEELGNKTIDVPVTGGVGGGTVKQVDFESRKEADRLRKLASDKGYNTKKIAAEFTDFPDEYLKLPGKKEELLELREKNPIEYGMKLNAAKNQYAVLKAVKQNYLDEIPESDPDRDYKAQQAGIHAANQYIDLNEHDSLPHLYDNIKVRQRIISQNLSGEERQKALDRVKQDASQFINGTSKQLVDEWKQSDFSNQLDANQYAGLKTLELFEPEKYKQTLRILGTKIQTDVLPSIDVDFTNEGMSYGAGKGEETDESINRKIGLQTVQKNLADIGRSNAIKSLTRKIHNVENEIQESGGSEELESQYLGYYSALDKINDDAKKDDEKYPLIAELKFDQQVKEIMQDPGMNAAQYGGYRFAKGFSNTGNSIENVLVKTFGSKSAKDKLEMERLGELQSDQNTAYLPESYKPEGSSFIPKFSKDISDQIKNIYADDTLNWKEKEQRSRDIMSQNQDKVDWVTNPDAGKSKNFFSKSTLYGNAGLIGDITSIATQSLALGAAGASRIVAATVPMYTTAQNDFYKQAIAEGNPNPMTYANVHAGIMALAGMINPDLAIVKRSLGLNTAAGKFIAGIDQATWDSVVNKNKPLLEKFVNAGTSVAKEGAKIASIYGAGTSVAKDLTDKYLFGKNVSGEDIVDHAVRATKDMAINSVALLGLGAVRNFKSVSPMEKANIWEAGSNKDISIQQIEDAISKGEINREQGDQKIQVIKDIAKLIEEVPTTNAKGKPLTDKQRVDFLYNNIIADKAKELKSDATEGKKEELDGIEQQANGDNNKIISGYPRKTTPEGVEVDLTPEEVVIKEAKDNKLGVYSTMVNDNPTLAVDILRDVAQQMYGINDKGEPLEGGSRKGGLSLQFSTDMMEAAEKKFPTPESTLLNPEPPRIKTENETATNSEAVEGSLEINEPAKTGETAEVPPPITEGGEAATEASEGDKIRLSHADTEKIYKEQGLPERLETPTKSDIDLEANADKLVEKGYNFDKEADKVMKGEKHSFTDEEQVAFAKVVGALKAKQEGMDVKSPEFDALQDKIEKYSRASDVVGTLEGRALRARQLFVPKEESLSDYVMREKEAAKVDVLTDAQKETAAKEHEEISKLTKDYEDKIQSLKDENARILAEAEVKKLQPKTKGEKKDYKKERAEIFTSIQDKLRKARGDTSVTVVPYAKELFAIAPDVAKLVKSYAEQGVTELADMIKKVHSDLKEAIPDIKDTDVRDLIAGAYNEKKRTRTELAEKLRDLRDEAKYINKLDAILRGEEPKTERAKIERNKKIKDLREKIKDIQRFDKDVEAQKKATAEAKEKVKSGTESELGKAEKEIEKSEEKEQNRLQKEAAQETRRLEREFEQEKKKEEREALKQKLAEARRIEKELSFKTPEERALAAFKTRTQSQIDKIEAQIKSGDFSELDKAPIKLDKEAQDLQDKLIKLKNERQLRLLKEEYRASSKWNKIQTEAANVLGVPRTLMASIDYSAPLRQALLPTLSHPLLASKAGLEMFKASFSQKNYDRWFSNLENSERFKLIKDSGLGITDVNNPKLSAKEEQFMNGLAEKIPLVGRLVKGSERAYTIYINKMRVDLFNRFADNMQSRGLTFENAAPAYKQLAAYVNNMTGRGDLGKTMNEAAPVLNQLFFSPRLMASRINTLTYLAQPRFWNKVPKEARIDYFRSLVATAGIGLTVLALAKLNGAETEDDPRSPDFGKVKSGSTRWDIWGGHQQYIRLVAQMVSGKKKSSTTGRISEIGTDNPYSGTRGGLGLDFLRGKLAPVPSIAVDILAGENSVGQKLTTDWIGTRKQIGLGENLANHLLPLTFTGLHDALKDQGVKAWFTVGVPSVFGVGTQTYNSGKKK